jgi:methionyl-tRNA synthetase
MRPDPLTQLLTRVKRTLTPDATPVARSLELYQRFGPILFSHFLRTTGDEHRAMAATREAFERLLETGLMDDREVVAWVRSLDAGSLR